MHITARLVILVALLLSIAMIAPAETLRLDEGVSIGMLSRIFPIRSSAGSGTCFVIEVDERQYLITARHIVPAIDPGGKVEIFFKGAWVPISVNAAIFPVNDKIDAVALATDTIHARRLDIPVGSAGVILGQKVFFLGFPFNLASRSKDRYDFIPFVKAGVLSAIDNRNKDAPVVYIDGHNNPGFSGGPIIFSNFGKGRQLQILAVISGYRNQPTEVVEVIVPDAPTSENDKGAPTEHKSKKLQFIRENTGIVIAYQLNELVEAIKNNPQGPKLVP
jgi:hypothetical protein